VRAVLIPEAAAAVQAVNSAATQAATNGIVLLIEGRVRRRWLKALSAGMAGSQGASVKRKFR
jgi:hypothetical protein